MLYPYKGVRQDDHFGPGGTGAYSRDTYGADESKTKIYSFNTLGFRGEEFDPEAPLKVFVCGCSMTFGTGLNVEESWPFLLKQELAEQRGLDASSVNLLNFSQGGASNDYITRTLIEQSSRVRPDVMFAGFTHMSRFELLDETMAFHFQSTTIEDYQQAGGRFAEIGRLGEFLFHGTDEIQATIRMIKNVLLLQYFCRTRDIPLVFLFLESLNRLDLLSALSIPTTQPLLEEIDLDSLARVRPDTWIDFAADRLHPGPRSHVLLAEAAWKTFCARYAELPPDSAIAMT